MQHLCENMHYFYVAHETVFNRTVLLSEVFMIIFYMASVDLVRLLLFLLIVLYKTIILNNKLNVFISNETIIFERMSWNGAIQQFKTEKWF